MLIHVINDVSALYFKEHIHKSNSDFNRQRKKYDQIIKTYMLVNLNDLEMVTEDVDTPLNENYFQCFHSIATF